MLNQTNLWAITNCLQSQQSTKTLLLTTKVVVSLLKDSDTKIADSLLKINFIKTLAQCKGTQEIRMNVLRIAIKLLEAQPGHYCQDEFRLSGFLDMCFEQLRQITRIDHNDDELKFYFTEVVRLVVDANMASCEAALEQGYQ